MRIGEEFPDPARGDAGFVVSGEWAAGSADRLVAAADAVIAARRSAPWPEGLLAYSLFIDADGDLLRDYAQWTDEAAAGPVRRDHVAYHLYRGSRSNEGTPPGAMVAVRVDTDDDAVARTWVDAVFAALDQDTALPAGGLGAFFHVSTDGRHVLNYAEWVSADAHRKALAATGRGISSGPLWDKVQTMPGVRHQSVTRYHLYRTLTA
ncbi:hypothetical protein AB0C12_10820 [Actinoplanes sp. NPDC048967]|uniref:hypothetical protein n=1 Tax=Actinoplanes sp. NPDC048967 TaxID=3155269 RepID=UPI0033E1475C